MRIIGYTSSPDGCREDCPACEDERLRKTAHTPTPWSYSGSDNCIMAHGPNHLRFIVATVEECFEPNTQHANAAHIVLCVNSHDRLVEACGMAREVLRRENLLDYNGVDEFVDSDGVKGIGDVLDAALAALAASQPKP